LTGDVVNLRRARKNRDRKAHEAQAAQNRIDHGRSKSGRDATAAQRRLDESRFDAHRREPGGPERS